MLIENESNWRTDDLKSLVEQVTGMKGFQLGLHFRPDTLLLFVTSRISKPPVTRFGNDDKNLSSLVYPSSAVKHHDTTIVGIQTAKQLQMEPLDRMAHIGGECIQDMSSRNVVQLARTIGSALCRYTYRSYDYSWAAKCSMRTRPNIKHSLVARERKILWLRNKQDEIRLNALLKTNALEEQIAKLKALP